MLDNTTAAVLKQAAAILQQGGVVITPTEGVYGFSCLFDNVAAIERILQIKGRAAAKGLITVCASADEALQLTQTELLPDKTLQLLRQLWPGPHTFVLPCKMQYQGLLTGFRETIAIRVTAFPLFKELCVLSGKPLVSTSANLSGRASLTELDEVQAQFASLVDFIIPEPCQGLSGPSSIHDGLTGKLLRQGGH